MKKSNNKPRKHKKINKIKGKDQREKVRRSASIQKKNSGTKAANRSRYPQSAKPTSSEELSETDAATNQHFSERSREDGNANSQNCGKSFQTAKAANEPHCIKSSRFAAWKNAFIFPKFAV